MPLSVTELITLAAEIVGNESKLAARCKVSQNAIWQARTRGRISAELAKAIHWATDQKIPGSALRPDLWLDPDHVPPIAK